MNKYFFQLKKERHLKRTAAAATGDKYCHKCEKWGYFCKCD